MTEEKSQMLNATWTLAELRDELSRFEDEARRAGLAELDPQLHRPR